MKIYTRIVMDSMTGNVEEADFFEYEGQIAELKDSPSPPPPPDYAGAAVAQGAANKDAAIAGAQLSNPNITNPYGQQRVTYQIDPTTGNPVPYVDQSLSPIGQQRFNQNLRIDQGLGDVAERGLGYVQNALNNPFDQSSLPARTVNAGQTGQDAIMARLEPQMQRRTDALENKLINQGLRRGSEAFDNAMLDQGMIDNDLLTQAALQGISLGDQARSKAIQEESFFRNEPLNMLNAVRSASPVGMPQFQNYTGQNVAPAPVFQGAMAQGQANQNAYNAQQAGDAMFMQGLMGLGGGLMSGAGAAGGFGRLFRF